MKYKTKPFEIEAVKFTGNIDEIKSEFPDIEIREHLEFGSYVEDYQVWYHLQKTWVTFYNGQYIIKGMKGEFYPCDAEVFEAKYESATEQSPIIMKAKSGEWIIRADGTAEFRNVRLFDE
jgi:hypothetical protein